MAPEVYFGRPYGKTVDIYSLGLVLYRLTNRSRLPFYPLDSKMIKYTDREEALSKRMAGTPLPAPCEVSPEFAEVILKACAADPKDRYRGAKELKTALEKLKYQGKSHKNTKADIPEVVPDQNRRFQIQSKEEPEERTVGVYEGRREETFGVYDSHAEYGTGAGEDTIDKVFLLSISEAEELFQNDEARVCLATLYAKAPGVHESGNGSCWWSLRSPGYRSNRAANVVADGSVNYYGFYVNYGNACARPALWINLGS